MHVPSWSSSSSYCLFDYALHSSSFFVAVSLFIRIFACCNKSTKVCSQLFFLFAFVFINPYVFLFSFWSMLSSSWIFFPAFVKKNLYFVLCVIVVVLAVAVAVIFIIFAGFCVRTHFYSFLPVHPSEVELDFMKFIGLNEGSSENRIERMHSPTEWLRIQQITKYRDQEKSLWN